MLIIVHIILALASLGLGTHNFFAPSTRRMEISYGLAGGTLFSGILLIVVNNASVLRTCLTGIVFFAAVSLLNELARKKLASDTI